MGQATPATIKSLALIVLRNARAVPAQIAPGTDPAEVSTIVRPVTQQPSQHHKVVDSIAPCGSPRCAGCYEVEPGVRIHPPKCGEEYRAWLIRWGPRGRVQ